MREPVSIGEMPLIVERIVALPLCIEYSPPLPKGENVNWAEPLIPSPDPFALASLKLNVNVSLFAACTVERAIANCSPTNQNLFIIPPKFALAVTDSNTDLT